MTRDAAMAHLDTYLDQVRRGLKGLAGAEAAEVMAELRSHVLDRVEGRPTPAAVEAALAALGSPREVARLNLTERVAASMERNRSPLGVLAAVVRLAGLSLMGFATLMVSLLGYGLAAGLLMTAVAKPFVPDRVGLWRVPDPQDPFNYSLGIRNVTPAGQELLGGWIVPIGLALGLAIGWLTWRFGVFSVRSMGRSARGIRR